MENKRKIISFRDLEVYRRTYETSVEIMIKILPKLPDIEKFDLKSQLSRSCKAIPRLIAEGYAKRHQNRGFQKYIDDAMGECNEIIVSLSHCKDIYYMRIDTKLCEKLIDNYDISARQLYRLEEAWSKFKGKHKSTT